MSDIMTWVVVDFQIPAFWVYSSKINGPILLPKRRAFFQDGLRHFYSIQGVFFPCKQLGIGTGIPYRIRMGIAQKVICW